MRLLKTSSALPENHVLYNFNTKPTVFKYWREFQSSQAIFGSKTLNNKIWPKRPPDGLKITFCTILIQSLLFSSIGVNFSPVKRFLDLKTLNNEIWPKRPPDGLKSTFCTIFMESLLFSRIGVNFGPLSNFWIWNVEKCDLAKTSSAWPEKHVLYNFHTEPTVFKYWREFQSGKPIFGSKTLNNEIWSKRPPHGLKSTFCTIFIQSLQFFTYWREFQSGRAIFWSKALKIAIWSKRPPHGLKSTFCTIFIQSLLFSRIGVNFGSLSNFWIWNVEKCDLVKTSLAWPEKHVLYNFDGKPTVFTYSREFQSGRAIFWSKTLKNAIWPKRPPHGLKSRFCTIFIQSLQFSRIGVNFSPVERFFWSKTLKIAISSKRPPHGLKSTFSTIFIQSLQFSRIGANFGPLSNFWIWNVEKCDLAKTSSAWPEKHVFYNFYTKPTVFTYWR